MKTLEELQKMSTGWGCRCSCIRSAGGIWCRSCVAQERAMNYFSEHSYQGKDKIVAEFYERRSGGFDSWNHLTPEQQDEAILGLLDDDGNLL